jgi:hypothetical protein
MRSARRTGRRSRPEGNAERDDDLIVVVDLDGIGPVDVVPNVIVLPSASARRNEVPETLDDHDHVDRPSGSCRSRCR